MSLAAISGILRDVCAIGEPMNDLIPILLSASDILQKDPKVCWQGCHIDSWRDVCVAFAACPQESGLNLNALAQLLNLAESEAWATIPPKRGHGGDSSTYIVEKPVSEKFGRWGDGTREWESKWETMEVEAEWEKCKRTWRGKWTTGEEGTGNHVTESADVTYNWRKRRAEVV